MQNPYSKFILAVKTLSVGLFSKFLQVLLGQTKTEILTSKHFVYQPPYKIFLRKTIIRGKFLDFRCIFVQDRYVSKKKKKKKINKLILLNLKHGAQRSHSEACSLKKCTLPYIYLVFKCLMLYFGIEKEWLEKKFEYFFVGSEHP